jgi:hypothetical protein
MLEYETTVSRCLDFFFNFIYPLIVFEEHQRSLHSENTLSRGFRDQVILEVWDNSLPSNTQNDKNSLYKIFFFFLNNNKKILVNIYIKSEKILGKKKEEEKAK